MMRKTRNLLITAGLVLSVFVLLVVAFFVVRSVRRDAAISRVEAMGGSVEIKWVSSVTGPGFSQACWVDLEDSILDKQQIDDFVIALDQINLSDLRVDMGRTAITKSQQSRLMGPASHLSHRTVPSPKNRLRWVYVRDATELPGSRPRLPMVVFFENQSKQLVKFYHVNEDKQELRAELRPGRTLQAVTSIERTWLIADEKDLPAGYFAVDNAAQGPGFAVIPALTQRE